MAILVTVSCDECPSVFTLDYRKQDVTIEMTRRGFAELMSGHVLCPKCTDKLHSREE